MGLDKLWPTHTWLQAQALTVDLKPTMRANLSATREAPPTRAPSMSGHAMSSSTVSGVTDPPNHESEKSVSAVGWSCVNTEGGGG